MFNEPVGDFLSVFQPFFSNSPGKCVIFSEIALTKPGLRVILYNVPNDVAG